MSKKLIFLILIGTVFTLTSATLAIWYVNNNSNKTGIDTVDEDIIQPTTQTEQQELLLKYEITGGLCPYGGCYSGYTFYRNGNLQTEYGDGEVETSTVDTQGLEDALNAISIEEVYEVRNSTFEGTCPTAYDGSEVIFTFYYTSEKVVLKSCTHDFSRFDEQKINVLYSSLSQIISN